MQVNKIQSQNFQAHSTKRFLAKEAQENLRALLSRMNSETKYNADRLTFSSDMLLGLKVGEDFFLHDKRGLVAPLNGRNYKSKQDDCMIEMGKAILDVNSTTGEIVKYKKPFYKRFKTILEKLNKSLEFTRQSYDNPEIVDKRRLKIAGFTEEGIAELTECSREI